MRKSFIIHLDSLDVLDHLTDEQAGILFKQIKNFQNGVENNYSQFYKILFLPFEKQFIRDSKEYEKVCNRNKMNGLKGGRPLTKENPKKPTGLFGLYEKPKKPDSDSDSDSDSKSEIYNSENLKFSEKEKTKKLIKEKKEKKTKCLFENSPVHDRDMFIEKMKSYANGKFINADIDYYYDSVKSWATSKDVMRTDWIAVAAQFMLSDIKNNKYKRKI